MRRGKAVALLSLSALIGALPYLSANAYVCCDPWGVPGATAFIQAGSQIISTLTAQVATISQRLANMQQTWATGFGKGLEYRSKQTAAERTFAQGRIEATTDLYMNTVRGEATERAIAPAMIDETVTDAALMSEQLDQDRANRRKEDAALAVYLRSSDAAPSTPVTRHAPFCDPQAYAAGLCTSLPSSSLQDADLMASTITDPGDGQYETMSDQEVAAGRAFIRNVVAPIPLRTVRGDSAEAEQYQAMLLADQAALSLAGHSLNSVMLHRARKRGDP